MKKKITKDVKLLAKPTGDFVKEMLSFKGIRNIYTGKKMRKEK